jgi:catechol 2,3-dioxygenase-like lactoylglutathione lyase family enzyme
MAATAGAAMSEAPGMDDSRAAPTGPAPALKAACGINHVAYRCRDAEQTRWFYEDVLGLPLVATVIDEVVPGLGDKMPFMHLFFELGNGEYVAFFDQPQSATPKHFERAHSFDRHIALEVEDEAALRAWQQRINARGVSCLGPVDHGFVKSVYMYDPNGTQVELTCRAADFERQLKSDRPTLERNMREWTERMRAEKESRFGAAALDQRSRR